MLKFIKSILLFFLLSFLIYVLLICLWGTYAPDRFKKNLVYELGRDGHMFSRIQDMKQTKDIDVLILGSSHAYRGFDTRIFNAQGITAFNLGSSAQSPLQTELLLKRYIDQVHPKLIIYEVFPGIFSSDGVESSLDIIANDKNDFESVKLAIKQNHIKVYNALIYGFYQDLFHKNDSFHEKIIKGKDTYIPGGFVERKLYYYKTVNYIKAKWDLKEEQVDAFRNILSIIENKNIPFILVQAPITPSRYQSYSNNNEFDEQMKSYGTYYNFNELIHLDDSLDFYDTHHLNKIGVEKFNNELLKKIPPSIVNKSK